MNNNFNILLGNVLVIIIIGGAVTYGIVEAYIFIKKYLKEKLK